MPPLRQFDLDWNVIFSKSTPSLQLLKRCLQFSKGYDENAGMAHRVANKIITNLFKV